MAFQIKSSGGNDEHSDMAEINIIPLVDVMLVLLIIFMVAAPLTISGIKVNLPTTAAKGAQVEGDRTILSINSKGEYFIETMKIPSVELVQRMKAIYQHKDAKELFIRADRGVEYGKVVDAMGAAKLAGVTKMSMLTKPKIVNGRADQGNTSKKF